MTPRLPFNKRDRRRLASGAYGQRALCDWGAGDLPAPFAAGDIVDIPVGAECLQGEYEPGPYVVEYCWSIDEGDAWYVRLARPGGWYLPWRWHLAWASRSTYSDIDRLNATLIDTADPEGLALRERLLAEGWSLRTACPTCGRDR